MITKALEIQVQDQNKISSIFSLGLIYSGCTRKQTNEEGIF